ncbi:MAG: amidohydrolase [Bacteroidaceae bacterium]|nr:amidohydrolase [Bacteroidaceae bacterium]
MTIIDAHSHLWLHQDTEVGGKKIKTLKNGRSIFMDEEVQMIPPFMIDGVNSAEVFLSNMDYAQVNAAVVVQEIIDGQQNDYLLDVQKRYPNRFFTMGMPDMKQLSQGAEGQAQFLEETRQLLDRGFRGIAIPGHRLTESVKTLIPMCKLLEERGIILDMCLDDNAHQIAEMAEVIQECPNLKVAIGHFGMVTTPTWKNQILLARESKHVTIESGGITWLYNSEFYPYPSAIRSIKEAADMVGMDRLMWGSDYPRTITAITYKMSYDFVSKSQELTDQEKVLFLGENARKFYGFKDLVELPYIKNMSE